MRGTERGAEESKAPDVDIGIISAKRWNEWTESQNRRNPNECLEIFEVSIDLVEDVLAHRFILKSREDLEIEE